MTAQATCKTSDTVRGIATALVAAARQISLQRMVLTVAGITVLVVVALLVQLPTAVQMREWASSVGPWFPLVFLLVHVAITVPPFPRTAFTVAAGMLFGPVLGIVLAVTASTASAVLALLLVRATGWRLNRLVHHRAVDRLDERLRDRCWPTILSLRLIPAVPFAALNYGAGASTVRVTPYALSTLAGLLPGTAAVVILGDALATNGDPLLVLISVCTAALGMTGLIFEVRHYRRQHHRDAPQLDDPPVREPAITC
ncbi:TVP38/TMEM64 family inner membrane protein YdjZ [Mycobacterium basiliense]|uniref:TVP38/TMEM64 family membrane protein n=1 Tax=Mycobacterium basiliense TaxID=2094119 RepID=A0A3S4CBB1_9MYCO|nr:TVP38/TMEM64 family protein [Mycobacterium basiliense]VDM88577.1 TVP38/TMEM64 family inner membrane protein YdjZ [Mycobacterium basiliense]